VRHEAAQELLQRCAANDLFDKTWQDRTPLDNAMLTRINVVANFLRRYYAKKLVEKHEGHAAPFYLWKKGQFQAVRFSRWERSMPITRYKFFAVGPGATPRFHPCS